MFCPTDECKFTVDDQQLQVGFVGVENSFFFSYVFYFILYVLYRLYDIYFIIYSFHPKQGHTFTKTQWVRGSEFIVFSRYLASCPLFNIFRPHSFHHNLFMCVYYYICLQTYLLPFILLF